MKVLYSILDLRCKALHVGNSVFSEHFIKGLPIYSPCFFMIPDIAQIVPEVLQRIISLSDVSLNFQSDSLIIIAIVILGGMLFDHINKKSCCIFVLFALLLLLKDKLGTFLHRSRWFLDRVNFL